jgi:hypothetical protein
MRIEYTDYNGADDIFSRDSAAEWADLKEVLEALPIQLKASDQAGIQGTPIFDVVATNQGIKDGLAARSWHTNLPIPDKYKFLGTDVDFVKNETLAEAQFSNYPFLLNNTIRSELFFKADMRFTRSPVRAAVIITKARLFPASNSTLYYEQGRSQLNELARHNVFDVPIRLVGLMADVGRTAALWTEYENPRYSRTVVSQTEITVNIAPGATSRSRANITRL